MSDEHAEPGDTIEITHSLYSTGEHFVVIKKPPEHNRVLNDPGDAWINDPEFGSVFWKQEHYKIVKRAGKKWIAHENGCVTGDVDKNMRKRVNENLRSVFG
jgi:hypothetical protein